MQGLNTCLNHVLTTLGNLYYIYSNPDVDAEVQNKVLASLEKHWAAADQDAFIAAVQVLNSFLHGRCLSQANPMLTPIGLCNMLKHLHLCVFKVAVDASFQSAYMDYYNECEEFRSSSMGLEEWQAIANEKVSLVMHSCISNISIDVMCRLVKQIPLMYGRVLIPMKNMAATTLQN